MATRNSLQIPGLQPNSTYVVQLRGVDAYGNPGQWSTQFEFEAVQDHMPPAKVTGLTAAVQGSNFIFKWNQVLTNEDGSLLEDLRDYVVIITANGQTAQFATTDTSFVFFWTMNKAAFGNPQPALDVVVRARDRVGNLSIPAPINIVKPPPGEFFLIGTAKRLSVELQWTDSGDELDRYEVWKNVVKYTSVGDKTLTWTDNDVGEGAQTYFVRAVDRFEQFTDSNPVVEGEISLDLSFDRVPPKPPTNLTYTDTIIEGTANARATFGWAAPTQDADDSSYTDPEGFELRYRTSPTRPWNYVRIPDSRADGSVPTNYSWGADVPQGATVYWSVRAFDRSYNYSDWASMGTPPTAGVDSTPPPKPGVPVVAGSLQTLQITHNLRDASNNMLPVSVQQLEIHVSESGNFTPSDSTLVGTVPVNSLIRMGMPLVWSTPYPVSSANQSRYVRVVAVTSFPIKSTPSDVVGPRVIELVQAIHIEDATITNAKIHSVSAAKLTAGSAFVNDLEVKSTISVEAGGHISSSDFNYDARTGWSLDNGNLYMFDGEIDARLITLQQGANIIDHGYAMFSYPPEWYAINIDVSSNVNFFATLSPVWSRYGFNSLRLQNVSGASRIVYFSPDDESYNIRVEEETNYIVSAYVHNGGASAASVQLGFVRDGAGFQTLGELEVVQPGDTRRIHGLIDIPDGVTAISLAMQMSTNGSIFVDGMQLERQVSNITEPSFFKTGGVTTIDAGSIATGVINIDRIGGNSIPLVKIEANLESDNFVTGPLGIGWRINRNTGDVEFNNGVFRGDIFAENGTFAGELKAATGTFSGHLSAASGSFKGHLDAATGTFTGMLSGGSIRTGSNMFNVDATGRMWIGNSVASWAPFRVEPSGAVFMTNATISGHLQSATGTFSGTLQGVDGTFRGTLQAVNGTFGTIEGGIYKGQIFLNNGGLILNNDGIQMQIRENSNWTAFRLMNGSTERGRIFGTLGTGVVVSSVNTISFEGGTGLSSSSIHLYGTSAMASIFANRILFGQPSGNQANFVEIQAPSTGLAHTVMRPLVDNMVSLGNVSRRWRVLYAVTGTIQTSDVRAKEDIKHMESDDAIAIARNINPILHKMKGDGKDAPEHFGFDAAEVKQAFADRGINFAGVYDPHDDPMVDEPSKVMMGMNYAEMIPLLWAWVQELEARLDKVVTPGPPN
jgi:hypothetical protein